MTYHWKKQICALTLGTLVLGSLSACDSSAINAIIDGSKDTTTSDSDSKTGSSKTSNPTDNSGSTSNSTTPSETSSNSKGWALFSGTLPCADKAAMWWDTTEVGFWGCGKRGDNGLFTTTDGGMNWAPQRKFGGMKVQGITRAPDKTMYISGAMGSVPVVKVDESNPSKFDFTELYVRGNNAFTSLAQGENVAVTSDGQILSESLTGTTAAYFPGNNAKGKAWFNSHCDGSKEKSEYTPDSTNTWCEIRGLGEERIKDPAKGVYQVTALQAVNDKFYATGRHIINPANVRLPSKDPDATFHFQTIQLQKDRKNGEMMDLKVWENGRIITVGTDQTSGAFMPLIYLCDAGSDCYDRSNWKDIELDDHGFEYEDSARDGRAVDGAGDTIVAVGNFVPNAKGGWAVQSTDGGKTWKDLTPMLKKLSSKGKVKNLYDVKVFENGKIMLFGDESFVFTP